MSNEEPLKSKIPLFRILTSKQPYPNEEEIYSTGLSRIEAGEPFIYEPFRPRLIRTFKIILGEDGDPLEGYMFSHTLMPEIIYKPRFKEIKTYWKEFGLIGSFDGVYDSISYETLSYTWGSNQQDLLPLRLWPFTARDNKLVPQFERAGVLWIRKNLRDFLLERRRREDPNFIWMDAVCINQHDNEDRDNHLSKMKWIYRWSTKVWIWFGEGSEELDAAMKKVVPLADQLLEMDPRDTWTSEDIDHISDHGLPDVQDPVWAALRALLVHPWWSRIWTLQEVNMIESPFHGMRWVPAELLCGSSSLAFRDMERFVAAVSRLGLEDWMVSGSTVEMLEDRHAFDSIKEIRAIRDTGRAGTVGLRVLLQATRRRDATFPQDMILGQAGLHYFSARQAFKEIGVSVNDSVRDIFLTFAKHYISQELGECLLNHVNTIIKRPGLPSWCPNFSSRPENFCLGSRWRGSFGGGLLGTPWEEQGDDRAYHAGFKHNGKWKMPRTRLFWGSQAWINRVKLAPDEVNYFDTKKSGVQLVTGTDQIICSGIGVDIVSEIIDCNTGAEHRNFFSADSRSLTWAWALKCIALARAAAARAKMVNGVNDDSMETLARALTANRLRVTTRFMNLASATAPTERVLSRRGQDEGAILDSAGDVDFSARMTEYLTYCKATQGQPEDATSTPVLSAGATSFARMMHRVTRRRRVFATENGRIGIGPSNTKPGDVLCVVLFCPTPYLLREQPDGQYWLIGETYVHGLMYGEALDMLDNGEASRQTWTVK